MLILLLAVPLPSSPIVSSKLISASCSQQPPPSCHALSSHLHLPNLAPTLTLMDPDPNLHPRARSPQGHRPACGLLPWGIFGPIHGEGQAISGDGYGYVIAIGHGYLMVTLLVMGVFMGVLTGMLTGMVMGMVMRMLIVARLACLGS